MNYLSKFKNSTIGVISDDLTGASDSGIQFVKEGLNTKIYLDKKTMNEKVFNEDGVNVVIAETETRDKARDKSYKIAFDTASIFKEMQIATVFKKIDSLLRGNWCIEVQAIREVYKSDLVIIAPAFPSMGRTTINGNQLLNNQPIHKTDVAKDPKNPIIQSNIINMLISELNLSESSIQNFSIKDFEIKNDDLERKFENLVEQKKVKWLIIDCDNDEELERITNKVFELKKYNILWVGTAGLANAMGKRKRLPQISIKTSFKPVNKPVLIVAGSMSIITNKQIKKLIEYQKVEEVRLNPLDLFLKSKSADYFVHKVSSLLNNSKDVVIYIETSTKDQKRMLDLGRGMGYTEIEISNKIADWLGDISKKILISCTVRNLILTGGDTARTVYKKMNISEINLIKEVEKGIPLSVVTGERLLNVVTKSGSFGSETSLLKAVNFLKGVD